MSIEHTSRTGADKGYYMVVPEDGCSTMNAEWHNASINYALQNVSTVTTCAAVTEALAGVPPACNCIEQGGRGLRPTVTLRAVAVDLRLGHASARGSPRGQA